MIVQGHANCWAGRLGARPRVAGKTRRIQRLGPDFLIVDLDLELATIQELPLAGIADDAGVIRTHLKHILAKGKGSVADPVWATKIPSSREVRPLQPVEQLRIPQVNAGICALRAGASEPLSSRHHPLTVLFVVCALDHEIGFERNQEVFPYEFEERVQRWIPDFRLADGTYVEIKFYRVPRRSQSLNSSMYQ